MKKDKNHINWPNVHTTGGHERTLLTIPRFFFTRDQKFSRAIILFCQKKIYMWIVEICCYNSMLMYEM